jgi:hypothetical protein
MTTMPTSDADRYAQLLQNLAVRVGAIREALERAFGVTLPTAPTLNAEFEIITSAIYAAADRPQPVPLTDDKPNTRTHFVYRIDIWTDDGKNIVEHLAGRINAKHYRLPHKCQDAASALPRYPLDWVVLG